jgi:uncharacterized protein
METAKSRQYPNFSLLAKPSGPLCNLDCKYCFYLEKEAYFKEDERSTYYMDEKTREEYIKQYLASQTGPTVHFAFQGGEPTLVGLDYFKEMVKLVHQHKEDRQNVSFALQTNGTRLNVEWAEFLKEHNFLVGLSIDGPEDLHDAYRVNKGGNPTHAKVMKALHLLQEFGVEYNTLTVINHQNSQRALDVYRFLKSTGTSYMQFIPIVERLTEDGQELSNAPNLDEVETGFKIPEWNVRPKDFGLFYNAIYDEWVRNDVGNIYIQMFDLQLGFDMGQPSSLCVYSKTCGAAGILEHNGDLYSCDHFVYPKYKLGNIHEKTMEDMFESEFQHEFGQNKFDKLPTDCKTCEFLTRCYGGCPKHRFNKDSHGEPGLNYLCKGYKTFFEHIKPTMAYMAQCLKQRKAPSLVMEWVKSGQMSQQTQGAPQRNAPCPCGSGKKYKQCCGK